MVQPLYIRQRRQNPTLLRGGRLLAARSRRWRASAQGRDAQLEQLSGVAGPFWQSNPCRCSCMRCAAGRGPIRSMSY